MEKKHPFTKFLELDFKTSDGTIDEMLQDAMIQAWNAALDAFTNEGLDYYDQSEFFKYPQQPEE